MSYKAAVNPVLRDNHVVFTIRLSVSYFNDVWLPPSGGYFNSSYNK